MKRRWFARGLLVLVLGGVASSCAYYNTFYLARRYYMRATDGQPYEVDREGGAQRVNYNKSADYSKKVLGMHPNSKWVDDAWLMWARTFVGTDDPLKAVAMLQEFQTRFPQSDLRPDAEFFLGLAYRQARKYELAVERFDSFLAQAPKHELVPYAWYERSRAMLSLSRPQEAASSAGQVIDRFSKHVLVDRALRQRAEARYLQRDWDGARADFKTIGERALTDDDRFRYLLREVDCLESSRQYDEARAVLRDARSHVPPPPPLPDAQRVGLTSAAGSAAAAAVTQPVTATIAPGADRYGRLTLRMGGVELLAGRVKDAVQLYETVLHDYPRTQLAAEAQYRIGYAYETGAEDFARARAEYEKVKTQTGQSQFSQQADQRLESLARIERFRTAGGADSLERKAEARFLTAEHYLFNLERPERALAEYRAIADSSASKVAVARALNAQAWLLTRKLNQQNAGDSLFWKVVREYPGTEAQLAARDFLEASGQSVPASLIVPPKEPIRPLLDLGDTLSRPPRGTPALGASRTSPFSDANRIGPVSRAGAVADSMRRVRAQRDTLMARAQRDTSAAGRARVDSLRRAFQRPDTTGRAAIMAEIERGQPRPEGVVVAPDSVAAPRLGAEPDAERVRLEGATPVAPSPLPEARGVEAGPELAPVPPVRDSAGVDTTRAARARRGTMDWLTGSDLRARPKGDLPPLPPQARVRRDSAGVLHANVPDSLRKFSSSPDPSSPNFSPDAPSPELGTPAATQPAAPEVVKPRGITSFERKTKAMKQQERVERARAKAVRDSVRQVKKAQQAVEKAQEKANKQKKKQPAVPPAVPAPAVPDTSLLGKARRDSLQKIAPPPALPDTARRDSSSGGRP